MATESISPISGATKIDTGNATVDQANKMQNNANLMAKYGAGNYDITASGDVVQKTSPVGIVTSNRSQTTYNENVGTMNAANTALKNSLQAQIDAKQKQIDNANNAGYGTGGANAGKDIPNKVLNPNASNNDNGLNDGSTTVTDKQGNNYTIPPGMDPGIASSMVNNLNSATDEIQSYKDQIEKLGSYDVNSDPVAVAAANSIKASYDILIQQMTDKNKMLMGGITVNNARNGMMQYGNEMDSMYKNAEFDAATQRIATLKQKEMDAINKSNEAYKSGNVKMLEQASKDLNAAQNEGRNALLDLQKTIDSTIKSNQAQAKIDAAEAKTQNATDITNSKVIAQLAIDQIEESGVTDEATIDKFIADVAEQNGISNPAILKGQMSILNPKSGTAALKNKNLQSQINNRGKTKTTTPKPKTDGGYSYTQDDVSSYISFLNKGGTAPDGTVYGGKGETYVNTGTYIAAYKDWTSPENGGTPEGFTKEFPVKSYVNPADYKSLPKNIRP